MALTLQSTPLSILIIMLMAVMVMCCQGCIRNSVCVWLLRDLHTLLKDNNDGGLCLT